MYPDVVYPQTPSLSCTCVSLPLGIRQYYIKDEKYYIPLQTYLCLLDL